MAPLSYFFRIDLGVITILTVVINFRLVSNQTRLILAPKVKSHVVHRLGLIV